MRCALRRAFAVCLLAPAAVCARASAPAVAVDPRFELLAVLRQLSGPSEGDARVEKRFGAFRAHPAVELSRALLWEPGREEAATTAMLYYSDPPELALKDPDADIHFVNGPREAAEMQRFLAELRRFARESGFMGWFQGERPRRAALEAAAGRSLGGLDPVAEIERYLGLSLATTAHYILLPPGAATRAFIVPYPLPPSNGGAERFDAYTMSPDLASEGFATIVWPEPLFVFIDPSFYYFEKLNIPDPAAFYGEDLARCRLESPDCVKHLAASALIERLERRRGRPAPGAPGRGPEAPEGRLVRALSARLDEYEADRVRYPTLWHFYPRWFAVFEEAAFPRRAPRALSVPAEPGISSTADFFKPAVSEALLRAGAR